MATIRWEKKEQPGICDNCKGEIVGRDVRAKYCWTCQKEIERDNRQKRLKIGKYAENKNA